MLKVAASLFFVLWVLPASGYAAVVTIEGTVKSVDAKKRTITVETEKATKTLDVSSKAKFTVDGKDSTLDSLKAGQKVTLSYHDELEIVLTVEVANSGDKTVLFDGKSLKGWMMFGLDHVHGWEARKDELVALPLKDVPLLLTEEKFNDFEFECDFWIDSKGNSGVYLRGRYEVQLIDNDSFPKAGPKNRCGSIVNQLAPTETVYRGPRQWNTLVIRLEQKTVTVKMNGTTIIDKRKIDKVTAESVDELENEPGPIAIQNRGGLVRFRNLKIRSLNK